MENPKFKHTYGPWAMVCGASEGLGAAWAHALAARGLNVLLVARREALMQQLAADITKKHNVETRTLTQDLAALDAAQVLLAATQALDIGLVIYNAAYGPVTPFLSQSTEDHARTQAINLHMPTQLAHGFGPRLLARGRGGVVLMSSLAGMQGAPYIAHYAATKAFNTVLAEGLHAEWRSGGVHVLACCAGATLTPNYIGSAPKKTPLFAPPEQQPEAVVREALGALGKRAYYLTGAANRLSYFFLHRMLGRSIALRIMANAMTKLYG